MGLKRFREFLRVAFGPKVSWRDYLEILKASIQIIRSPYSQSVWRERMRACYNCPIFNKDRKTCRPFPDSVMGCGCYTPYKALVKSQCWGKDRFGDNFGW